MIEFLRSSKEASHAAGDSSLGVDQEIALADDVFALFDAGEDGVVVAAGCTELDLPTFKLPVTLSHVNDLAHTRVENRRPWNGEDVVSRGRVGFLDTSINPQTRAASARIQVPNPRMRLRPGMFVQVKFTTPAGRGVLAIPRSAVLDTGMRKIVYVAKSNGEFEGRQVQLGTPGNDYYPVLSGVKEGEHIVSQGNFLIDSQTRITVGMTGLYGGSKEFDRGQAEQGQAQTPAVPQIKLSLRSDPETPRGNSTATLHVTAVDSSGKPVTGLNVKVALIMPAMPAMGMGEMRSSTDLAWKGTEYVGTIKVPMAGSWNVEVNASRNGQLLGSYHARLNAQ